MPDFIDEVVEEIDELGDELFPPKPGGMVDRLRKERAQREAAEQERRQESERVEEGNYKSVKVTQLSPEVTSTNAVNIPAGGTAMVLPLSEYRFRATIIATSVSAPTVNPVLAKDSSQALGGVGFPLPMNTPFVVNSRAQLWMANPGANSVTITVSVLSELYAPEK